MKNKKNMRKGSLRKKYSEVSDFLGESRPYIIFTLILFGIFSIIGFIFPVFFVEQIGDLLQNIEKEIDLMISQFGFLGAIFFIMGNNILSSFISLVFGFFLGFAPIFSAVFNGYLLGFVSNFAVQEKGILVLWRLLPHGVFEFPAIIISISLGIRLGTFFIFEKSKKNYPERLKTIFKKSLLVFSLLVIPLLIVAGIIEGFLIFLID